MKKFFIIFFFLFSFSKICYPEELTVAVAANMQFAFKELKTVFEKETDLTIRTVVGSSGKLTVQIENGAPFDLFLSADSYYPRKLYEKKLTYNKPKIYTYGTLILWTFNPLDFSGKKLHILNDPMIRKIAVSNPKTAPYGKAAMEALDYFKLKEKIFKKFVYGENVSQTNQFILSQACEIGITAKSAVFAPTLKKKGYWIEVPQDSYNPIVQKAVILKNAEKKHLKAAKHFFGFIFSEKARKIFQRYGYKVP